MCGAPRDAPVSGAAPARDVPRPWRFAHLSDPHLSTPDPLGARDWLGKRALGYLSWRRKRRFEHRAEVLEALRADLARDPPEQILVTGDLTQLGMPGEFVQGRRWLEMLGPPQQVGLVPGNHDCTRSEPWAGTLAHWQPYLDGDRRSAVSAFPSLRRRGGLALIGLSRAVPSPPLLATGRVGADQLGELETLLVATGQEGLFRVVYLHHSPVPGQDPWRKRLVDAPAVAAVIARAGAELVLHGHRHRVRAATLPSQGRQIPVQGIASASALGRLGEAAGYSRYLVSPGEREWRLELERRGYDGTRFQRCAKLEIRIPRPAQDSGSAAKPACTRR